MSQEETKNQIEQNVVKKKGLSMPVAVVIAGILIAGAILVPQLSGGRDAALEAAAARGAGEAGDSVNLVNDVDDSTDFIRGAKDPVVTIVEFSDFGCGFCATFHPTVATIVEENLEDVAWVYRHLPYRNMKAAQASECVGQELGDEAFWEYSDVLFAQFPNITNDLMVSEALRLGFSSEADFNECLESEETKASIQRDMTEARLLGASGTPFSLLITEDGRTFPLRGAAQLEQLRQIIEVLTN
jgi:protein-disulfide isomerase